MKSSETLGLMIAIQFVFCLNCTCAVLFTKFKRNVERPARLTHQYRTAENVPLLNCFTQCRGDPKCMSINYRRETQSCELNDKGDAGYEYIAEDGWEAYHKGSAVYGNSHYTFILNFLNWTMARDRCKKEDSYLLEIETEGEHLFIKSYMAEFAVLTSRNYDRWWTGANDIDQDGVFVWDNSSLILEDTNSGWNRANPDLSQSLQRCMCLYRPAKYHYVDNECRRKHSFVCERQLE